MTTTQNPRFAEGIQYREYVRRRLRKGHRGQAREIAKRRQDVEGNREGYVLPFDRRLAQCRSTA